MENRVADVCVVGAGFAGLAAARRLKAEGKRVVVLEARDRVGGRVWGKKLEDGKEISVGGTWVGRDQSRLFDLIGKVGLGVYPQYDEGDIVLRLDGKSSTYQGLTPDIGWWGLASMGAAFLELQAIAESVHPEKPWESPDAAALDAQSLGEWVTSVWHAPSENAQLMLKASLGMLFCSDLFDVSLLGSMLLAKGGGKEGFQYFIDPSFTETHLVDGGGMPEVARRLGNQLGDSLVKSAPVRRIRHSADHVVVVADGVTVRAGYVIVTAPPVLAAQIDYQPPLPEGYGQMMRSMIPGAAIRGVTVYETPFWREKGLTGQTVGPQSPVPVSIDQSPPAPSAEEPPPYGVLSSYSFGHHAVELMRKSKEERREIWLRELAERFDDPRAAQPLHHDETDWTAEQWSLGAMIGHFIPGTVTLFGPYLHQPYGRIYWAGTERATLMHGLIEGAIRSGEHAAHEIAQKLEMPEIPAV